MSMTEQKQAVWERLKKAVEDGVVMPNFPRPIYRPNPNNHIELSMAYLAKGVSSK